nr:IS630 family transposase [Cellvibrionaceae bacterium]
MNYPRFFNIVTSIENFTLTTEQVSALRVAHRAEQNRHAAYKINAVILLGTGWKLKDVKAALLLDDETLRSYVEKYKADGIEGLVSVHFQGRACLLTEEQQEALCLELEHTIFLTAQSVIEYVKITFNVKYSLNGMRALLHRLGYEYKKPKLVPGSPDREKQEQFVTYFEQFMEEKPRNDEVLFVDAVHPEHNTMAAYGWIKKGQIRKLQTNSGRQRLNLHGAINIETLEMTVVESSTVDTDSTIELLETLNQKYPGADRLHIILDNARYHYSHRVKDYLKDNQRINLVFLPSYSPELNLIERVWRYFKKHVLYNKYYED